MSLLIAGSIATDHLMSFPGKFSDSLVVDAAGQALAVLPRRRPRGTPRRRARPNICFGLGNLGLRPVLVGAVGEDFGEYRSWLERHSVDCDHVHVSETRHTARFVCTNDSSMAQIASFYAGAMSEAREIELKPIVDQRGRADVRPDRPRRPRGDAAAHRGVPPARLPLRRRPLPAAGLRRRRPDPRRSSTAPTSCSPTSTKSSLITQKTGWSRRRGARAGRHLGGHARRRRASGSTARARSRSRSRAVPEVRKVEPTGVGDAFRAGFLAALGWGLGHERAAQLGCLLAVVRRRAGRHAGVHPVPRRTS